MDNRKTVIDLAELREFIHHSFQHRYAKSIMDADDTPVGNEPSFRYAPDEGGWKGWVYEDRFYGGEPFGGNIQIFHEGKCIWYMDIQGKCLTDDPEIYAKVYDCLGAALESASVDFPYRGPIGEFYSPNGNGFKYEHVASGTPWECSGWETIKNRNGTKLFEATWRATVIG